MASPKSKTNNLKPKTSASEGAGYRLSGFLIIVVFASLGLVWLWIQLPKRSEQPIPQPLVVQPSEPATTAKTECKESGGTWIDCGLPVGCKASEPCAQVCVPQCLAKPAPEPLPEPMTPVREAPVGMVCDALNFICVDPTFAVGILTSPFIATGTGIAFENTINWRLLDGNGGVLEKGFVTANAPDIGKAGDFEIRGFLLNVPSTATGTLEVLEHSAKDGVPIHVVKIPVRLPTATMTVKYFFRRQGQGYQGDGPAPIIECSDVVQDTASVVKSSLPIETTLRYLLGSWLWDGMGHISSIPPDTRLVSLKVSSGTATVVFSPELGNYGGGSCNVQAIRAQIESTLKQFSSIKNVVISSEGKTPEESLQP